MTTPRIEKEEETTLPSNCSSFVKDPCPIGQICLVDNCFPGCIMPKKPCPMGMECVMSDVPEAFFGYALSFKKCSDCRPHLIFYLGLVKLKMRHLLHYLQLFYPLHLLLLLQNAPNFLKIVVHQDIFVFKTQVPWMVVILVVVL